VGWLFFVAGTALWEHCGPLKNCAHVVAFSDILDHGNELFYPKKTLLPKVRQSPKVIVVKSSQRARSKSRSAGEVFPKSSWQRGRSWPFCFFKERGESHYRGSECIALAPEGGSNKQSWWAIVTFQLILLDQLSSVTIVNLRLQVISY
jgi:hypothetical protein